MDITFINPGVDAMLRQIMEFQREEEAGFWSGPLYHFFPQLDKARANALPIAEKQRYIEGVLREVYAAGLEDAINQKAVLYARHWGSCKAQVNAALSDAFAVDCGGLFNDLCCHVSMSPIEPRFLREHRFNVFYLNSEKGAIGSCLHELVHFVWFYVWHELFGDSYDEYERPSLKWILSEMVVESVMRDPRLSTINPYFPREQGGCVYPYFFDMAADGCPVLDTLDEMYRSQSIREFMKSSYAYCRQHEAAIREHIKRAENN